MFYKRLDIYVGVHVRTRGVEFKKIHVIWHAIDQLVLEFITRTATTTKKSFLYSWNFYSFLSGKFLLLYKNFIKGLALRKLLGEEIYIK